MRGAWQHLLTMCAAIGLAGGASAQQQTVLDAAQSDPVAMGWMQGSPPPPDKRIIAAKGDNSRFPMTRWAFSHMREFAPTVRVARGKGPVWRLPVALRRDLDSLTFTPLGNDRPMRWDTSLAANYTDGIVILHRGRIVYERYFGATSADTPHGAFSVTKSFVGVMAEMLIAEGKLDPAAPVSRYVPEVAKSGFGDATIRQVMDMTTGLDYSEEYSDASSEVFAFLRASGLVPRAADYAGPPDTSAYLAQVRHAGQHGERFTYRSINTEMLGWIISRTEGKRLAQVLSERIWQRLGMESDADCLIDPAGMALAAGGLNPVVRDMARFGEAMRLGGKIGGRQVIPVVAIASVRAGGKRADFAKAGYARLQGWSYRSQWWVTHNADGAFAARGVYGQTIYVDPRAEMVIARFASAPTASSVTLDPTTLPAFQAVADRLMGKR